MALPTLQRKLFENDGYGPNIKDERLSTDITVKDWDASHDYPANVLAKAGGDIYRSVAASGPGTSAGAVNPTQDASAVYWEVFGKGGSVPVGTVIWLSTSTVPVGFLLCNGQAVGRAAYPDLFGAIGTTYGTGDGSTTFNLPNLIDKFIEGANSNIGDIVAAGLPNITGFQNMAFNTVLGGDSGALYDSFETASPASYSVNRTSGSTTINRINLDASYSNSIYGNSSTVQPPAVKLLPCIKAYSDVDNLGSLDAAQLENYVQNNFVHLTGEESISGHKVFHNYITIDTASHPSCALKARNMELNVAPSSNLYNVFVSVIDNENRRFGGLYHKYFSSKRNCISIITNKATTTSNVFAEVSLTYTEDGIIIFSPATDNNIQLGASSYRWKQLYAGTATINTSDARLKTKSENVPDNVLDAWGDVDFVQFQFKDAIAEKGQSARIHNGIIAQNISSVFESHGIDPSRYGLFCYDSWEATSAGYDQDGNLVEEAHPAGDIYSLRYEEALCMEAAYQRRRADRAEARIASLEARLAALEAKLNG